MMLKETLTSDLILAGERFITAMNEAGAQVSMGIWKRWENPDSAGVWRLLLVMPVPEAGGKLNCYDKVVSTFNSHSTGLFPLSIFDFQVESPESNTSAYFRQEAIARRNHKPDYSSEESDGFFISDSFVYSPKRKTDSLAEPLERG